MNAPMLQLFGAPVGLYTGKIRSYLRKQGIPFVERLPSDRQFQKEILPAIGRFRNPVIKTADGEIVQDTADIIDYLEARGIAGQSSYPTTPLQRVTALTLDLFGGEGLGRTAMHYRWSFRAEHETFLRREFGLTFRARGLDEEAINARLLPFMSYLEAYLPILGVTPESIPAIEASYTELLAHLDAHFCAHPYALGGRPTVADYGLIATLFAHLGRDPVPSHLMRTTAPSVFRWTERMMACDPDVPEFPQYPTELPDDDTIPATLHPVLSLIARDFLPELHMVVATTNAWLAAHPDTPAGTPAPEDPSARALDTGSFLLRGVTVTASALPYTLYMVQRVTDAFDALSPPDQARVRAAFAAVGLADLLTLKAARRVERRNHLEVWGGPS